MLKIAQVYIQDYGPFQNFQLDFTYPDGHPQAGNAMDQVCILGQNWVNKSALMGLLVEYLRNTLRFKSKPLFLVKLQLDNRFVYGVHLNNTVLFFRDEIDNEPEWLFELLRDQTFTIAFNQKYEHYCIGFQEEPQLFDQVWLDNNGHDLICHLPADIAKDNTWHLNDVPHTKGHEAESLTQTFPLYNEISPEKSTDFWALLIFLIVQRQEAWQQFCKLPESRTLTIDQQLQSFQSTYPDVLPELVKVWDPFLEEAGLELDLSSAVLPNHYRDRLQFHLCTRKDKKRVDFGSLDRGIRHRLFAMGHLWALGFRREMRSAFLLSEEPETNLHPRQIDGMKDRMYAAFQPSQAIFSSNSLHFARQFEPFERIVLQKDSKGIVGNRKGLAPKGASLDSTQSLDFEG